MSESLIIRNDASLSVLWTDKAKALKIDALEIGALIGKVTNAAEQQEAVKAQQAIQNILSAAEKARKSCKEPVLEFGRTIDASAKGFVAELIEEMTRISTLIGNFQATEQAKQRAAEALRQKELAELDYQRMEAVKNAKSPDEVAAIADHFADKAKERCQEIVQPIRAEGQIVRHDWTIEITDIWLLARCHPTCVKIEPRISEIKELLKTSAKLQGVKATEITKASVLPVGCKVIDV